MKSKTVSGPRPKAATMPHSWLVKDWPAHVVPGSTSRAKHTIRKHRAELLAVGALGRVGRDLMIFGEGYARFLARQTQRVENYTIAANREQAREAA